MRTFYGAQLAALVIWAAFARAANEPATYSVGCGAASHPLLGWGITPMALDWSGAIVLRGPAAKIMDEMYQDLQPDLIRIPLAANSLWDTNKRCVLDSFLKSAVLDNVARAKAAGIRSYVIAILSPPPDMKTYHAVEADVEGRQNGLRTECEGLFVQYLLEVLAKIKAAGTGLPLALSIQAQPDLPQLTNGVPPSTASAAYWTIGQWQRVAEHLRGEMDRNGYATVLLIGPECVGSEWPRQLLTAASAIPEQRGLNFIGGWAYVAPGINAAEFHGPNEEIPIPQLARECPIWALNGTPTMLGNDQSLIVKTFDDFCDAFGRYRCGYWLWQYGFSWDKSGWALKTGREGSPAPLYDILKYIWAHARSGSDVRELVIKRSAGVPDGLRGIYFASGGRRLLVLLNRGHHASSLSLDVPFAEGIMTNSSAGGALNIRAFGMGDRLMMEPMSVAVLIGKEPITLNSE